MFSFSESIFPAYCNLQSGMNVENAKMVNKINKCAGTGDENINQTEIFFQAKILGSSVFCHLLNHK